MANDYLLDREIQRTTSYTGIWSVNDQDRSVQESMGPIYDRRKEHLGSSDLGDHHGAPSAAESGP